MSNELCIARAGASATFIPKARERCRAVRNTATHHLYIDMCVEGDGTRVDFYFAEPHKKGISTDVLLLYM